MPFHGEIEGTGFETLDPAFAATFIGHARVERLWTGGRWLEGPAWFAGGRYLLFSDIPNDRVLRYDDTDGGVSVFRAPAMNANGHAVDREGRLVSCEHRGRRVTRTEHDGSITVLADRFEGKRFNSPNDVVVGDDGAIWFTDPDYGILTDYEGDRAAREQDVRGVYRIDLAGGAVSRVVDGMVCPNGLALAPDGRHLFVADTGATHVADGPRHIRRFRVEGARLVDEGVFATCGAGLFDGFRFDADGRIWTSAGDGVHCLAPDGRLIGKIRVPEIVANVTFGGAKRNRLFICGTTSLYAVFLAVRGAGRC
jgi:gluconolactonase